MNRMNVMGKCAFIDRSCDIVRRGGTVQDLVMFAASIDHTTPGLDKLASSYGGDAATGVFMGAEELVKIAEIVDGMDWIGPKMKTLVILSVMSDDLDKQASIRDFLGFVGGDLKEKAKQKAGEVASTINERYVEPAKDRVYSAVERAAEAEAEAKARGEEPKTIKEMVGDKINETKQKVENTVNEAVGGAKAKVNEAKEQVGQKINEAKTKAGEVRDTANAVIDGVKAKANEAKNVVNEAKEVAKDVRSVVRNVEKATAGTADLSSNSARISGEGLSAIDMIKKKAPAVAKAVGVGGLAGVGGFGAGAALGGAGVLGAAGLGYGVSRFLNRKKKKERQKTAAITDMIRDNLGYYKDRLNTINDISNVTADYRANLVKGDHKGARAALAQLLVSEPTIERGGKIHVPKVDISGLTDKDLDVLSTVGGKRVGEKGHYIASNDLIEEGFEEVASKHYDPISAELKAKHAPTKGRLKQLALAGGLVGAGGIGAGLAIGGAGALGTALLVKKMRDRKKRLQEQQGRNR